MSTFETYEQTITTTADPSNSYRMPRGGVLRGDAILTTGTATVKLQISFDGTNFYDAFNPDGSQISKALTSSDPHFPVETAAHIGVDFRFIASAISSGSVSTKLGRTIAE